MKKQKRYSGIFIVAAVLSFFAACNGANSPDNPIQTHRDTAYSYGSDKNTTRGQHIFEERCMDCHGQDGDKRKDNAANLKISRIDSISIVNTIKNGKTPMPMFGSLFSDSDMAQLELYVKSLRRY